MPGDWDVCYPSTPTAEADPPPRRIKKGPRLQTIAIAAAVERKPILCAAPHMRPSHNAGISPWGAAHRILMSHGKCSATAPLHLGVCTGQRQEGRVPAQCG